VPGVVGDTIAVGSLAPLSDAVAVLGKPITAGLRAYFSDLNAKGGVAGRYQVKVVVEDVTYANPSTSVQKYQKIKNDVVMMAQVLGTDHINTVLPLLAEDTVVAVPTTFDAEWVREPQLIPWGLPYQIAAINGVAYYVTEGGGEGRRICALTMATGYGDAGLEGLQYASAEMGFPIVSAARFRQDDQDFVAPITQLRNAQCEAVFLVSLPGVTGRLLGAAAQMAYAPRWIALMPSWHVTLGSSPLRDYFEKNLLVVWDGPQWGDSTVAGMRALFAAQKQFEPEQPPDLWFGAGWILGQVTHATLERAAAANDFSRAGIGAAVASLGRLDFDGLVSPYTYGSADQRDPTRAASIFRINASAPIGLELVRQGVTSPAAAKFTFERRTR
jgi:ABC-type branched-subunit amino acid transport system substrate-binding protein